jgi:hypothetical protein
MTNLVDMSSMVDVFANVGRYVIRLRAGDSFPTHGHTYSHAHAAVKGKCRVKVETPDGIIVSESEYEAPAIFELQAPNHHTFTAVTDYEGWCLFAVRDEDGGVLYEVDNENKNARYWMQPTG